MKALLILLSLVSITCFSAEPVKIENVSAFLNLLTAKANGFSGNEFKVWEDELGRLQVDKSHGGYSFAAESSKIWSYGFGFCSEEEESYCFEGQGEYKIQNGSLYIVFLDQELKAEVLKSTPEMLIYKVLEGSGAEVVTHRVQIELSKSNSLTMYESEILNGKVQRVKFFRGR